MEFSRQEYWSMLPFPSPGNLPYPRIEPGSPALQADALPSEPPRKRWLAHPTSYEIFSPLPLHHLSQGAFARCFQRHGRAFLPLSDGNQGLQSLILQLSSPYAATILSYTHHPGDIRGLSILHSKMCNSLMGRSRPLFTNIICLLSIKTLCFGQNNSSKIP